MKYFHKTVTRPPRTAFMKSLFRFCHWSWGIYYLWMRDMKSDWPPPVCFPFSCQLYSSLPGFTSDWNCTLMRKYCERKLAHNVHKSTQQNDRPISLNLGKLRQLWQCMKGLNEKAKWGLCSVLQRQRQRQRQERGERYCLICKGRVRKKGISSGLLPYIYTAIRTALKEAWEARILGEKGQNPRTKK